MFCNKWKKECDRLLEANCRLAEECRHLNEEMFIWKDEAIESAKKERDYEKEIDKLPPIIKWFYNIRK